MEPRCVALSFLLAAISLAQNIGIGVPKPGATIQAERPFPVQIRKPDTLTGSQEAALVIAIASCAQSPCLEPQDALGYVLYNGPFDPQFHTNTTLPPYQVFDVTIPSGFPKGAAQLNIVNFELIGAGPYPSMQLLNRSLTIA